MLDLGEAVGLVGGNDAGKRSLFALRAGRLLVDAGHVEVLPKRRLGEIAQRTTETAGGATDSPLAGAVPPVDSQAWLAAPGAADDGHAIADAHLALEEAGAFDARARRRRALFHRQRCRRRGPLTRAHRAAGMKRRCGGRRDL